MAHTSHSLVAPVVKQRAAELGGGICLVSDSENSAEEFVQSIAGEDLWARQ
jgi:hypothetical protein